MDFCERAWHHHVEDDLHLADLREADRYEGYPPKV